jgi:hypothetical protein
LVLEQTKDLVVPSMTRGTVVEAVQPREVAVPLVATLATGLPFWVGELVGDEDAGL